MKNYGPIDVSLTSISSRIPTLPQTIRSLLEQSYSYLKVNLYLSKEPYLLDEGVPELSTKLSDLLKEAGDRFRISYVENSGPYRKLLPYLWENWGCSKTVVTVDDDTIYPSDWLEGLLEAHSIYGCVVGYRGHQVKFNKKGIAPYRQWMRSGISHNPSPLILPTGKDGILYNTAFFPSSVMNLKDALQIAPTVDDLWFRWNLALNGINTYLLNTDYESETFEETDYSSSLYLNFNRQGGNDVAIAKLEQYFSDKFNFKITDYAKT